MAFMKDILTQHPHLGRMCSYPICAGSANWKATS